MHKVWYKGANSVACNIHTVEEEIQDIGQFFVSLVSQMSGITNAELIEQDEHSVVIKTNEGIMTRRNISRQVKEDEIILQFDEAYVAGNAITTHSHYHHKFEKSENGFQHTLTISDVKASGILGFLYKLFGSKNIGKDVLKAVKAIFLVKNTK